MLRKDRCKSNFTNVGLQYAYVSSVRKYKRVQLTSRIITALLPVLSPNNILPPLHFDTWNENFGAHSKNTRSFIFNFLNSRSLKFRKSWRGCIEPELLWRGLGKPWNPPPRIGYLMPWPKFKDGSTPSCSRLLNYLCVASQLNILFNMLLKELILF
jgi:hypothetical protein